MTNPPDRLWVIEAKVESKGYKWANLKDDRLDQTEYLLATPERVAVSELLEAADALVDAAWGEVESFPFIEDSEQMAARQNLKDTIAAYEATPTPGDGEKGRRA